MSSIDEGTTPAEPVEAAGNYPRIWPTAQVVKIAALRVACVFNDDDEPEGCSFDLMTFPSPTDPRALQFMGELSVVDHEYIARTTVQCVVRFKSLTSDLTDPSVINRYSKRYGDWISHVIWDHGTMVLRSALALLPHTSLEVPLVTPSPRILQLKDSDTEH